VSVARATRNGNGVARRSSSEWSRVLEERDRWRLEALELERALAACTAELFDARALAAQLDRRTGPRRVGTDSVLRDLRANVGRRRTDQCGPTCQCSAGWNPETRRYEVAL
jgi:hypothetical protein